MTPIERVESSVPTRPPRRFGSLDALRGIAATTVVFAHVHAIFSTHHILLDLTPLRVLWAGQEAVVLFFVLSGFVLSLPYCRGGTVRFAPFLIARASRIYLPYLAAFFFCLILASVFGGAQPQSSALLIGKWPSPMPHELVLQHIAFVGEFNSDAYNPVIWSLIHEMRFALIFPAFIWMLQNIRLKFLVPILAVLSLAAAVGNAEGLDASPGFKNSFLYSAHFLLFFMLGALVARHFERIGVWFAALNARSRFVVLCVAAALYGYSIAVVWVPSALGLESITRVASFVADWGVGLASVILIVFAIYSPRMSSFLNHKVLSYVGRISFSLYLVHLPVFMALLYLFGADRGILAASIGVPTSFAVAAVFHQLIEKPAQRIGHTLSRSGQRQLREAASDS